MSDEIFSAGDLIAISYGEYSSYGVGSIVKAMRDFTLDELKAAPGCLHPKQRYESEARISLEGMIAAGFVEELPPHREIWTGGC